MGAKSYEATQAALGAKSYDAPEAQEESEAAEKGLLAEPVKG